MTKIKKGEETYDLQCVHILKSFNNAQISPLKKWINKIYNPLAKHIKIKKEKNSKMQKTTSLMLLHMFKTIIWEYNKLYENTFAIK